MAGRFGEARLAATLVARRTSGGGTQAAGAAPAARGFHATTLPIRLEIPLTPELRAWLAARGFRPDAGDGQE